MENAVAIRMGFNADGKEFQSWLDNYSNEDPEEKERKKIAESVKAMHRLFGGS